MKGRRAGPPPAVDRLVRVPDGGDGHRFARCDEQRAKELQLRLGRVLELVEQHRPEPRPLRGAHLGHRGRDAGGESHLVREVQGVALPLEVPVALDERKDGTPLPEHRDGIADLRGKRAPRRRPARDLLQRRDDLVEVASDVVHAHEVLGHLRSEVDDGGGDGRLGLLHPLHRSVPRRDGLMGHLPRGRLTEHAALPLHAEPHPVLAYQPARVGVVGRHGRDVVEDRCALVGARAPDSRGPQAREPCGEALRELTRCLAGERESQHLVGVDEPVRHQPHDPGRHGLRLPRSRAGDDEQRPQRGLDDRDLLGRGRVLLAQRSGELVGAPAHTTRPLTTPGVRPPVDDARGCRAARGSTHGHRPTGCRAGVPHSRRPSG